MAKKKKYRGRAKTDKRQNHKYDDNPADSLGSGLDEVGFQPLGHRLIISQRPAEGRHLKKHLTPKPEPSPSDVDGSSPDDPFATTSETRPSIDK
ncbi:hypothetical protein GOC78_13915 [Sinorhizobium medicae]|nr:hypothetical protein [Sinorhizobium medicae]